jgi:glycosyltransferase involved in cell wall biosynthesis
MFWRYAWLQTRETGVGIRLGVSVPELQSEYSSVFSDERVHIWPICADARTPPAPRRKIMRIGFFGEQRGEKGTSLLQQVVPRLTAEGWQVVVHDSGHLIRGESAGHLIRLGYVEDIVAEIEKCDLIVVPYDAAAYRSRGSSIVWEAIACGVPVVAPQNSAPGRFALASGAGIGLQALTADEIVNAVFAANNNYKIISENAFLASRSWAINHGAGRYADALLAAA